MATTVSKPPGGWVFDLPLIGDDFAKIGRVIDLYAVPCKPNAELWVYGFFQAIPTLFISLTKPELIDINIRHRGRKPRKGKKFRFTAAHLFRDAIVEIPVPRWVVFRVYEFSQRIGWYFLVADALENFAINWISLAYKYNGCQAVQLVYGRREGLDLLAGSSTGSTGGLIPNSPTAVSNMEVASKDFRLIVPGRYRFAWEAQFRDYAIPSQSLRPYATMLLNRSTGLPVDIGEGADGGQGVTVSTGNVVIDYDGGLGQRFEVRALYTEANKFCRATSVISCDKIDGDELSPDP